MKAQSRQGISMRGTYRRARINLQVATRARGRATVQVLNPDQSVDQEIAANNLILNTGIDAVKVRSWAENMEVCVLGSGASATVASGGATLAAQAGTTIALTGGAFTFTDTATDAGKLVRWNTTEVSRILTVTDPTHAEVYPEDSKSVSSGAFNVYQTVQTVLDMTEIQRGNTYVVAGGGCGTNVVGNVVSHKRTFDFPAEVGSVTYREVAFSHSLAPGAEIFSRIKLPSDLNLVATQVVRVIYTLELTVGPSAPSAKTANIVGWPVAPATTTDGDEQVQLVALMRVDAANGASVVSAIDGISLEPSAEGEHACVFITTDASALAAFGASVDRTGAARAIKDSALDGTVDQPGVGYVEKVAVFQVAEGNGTAWRSLGIGSNEIVFLPYTTHGFVFLFDEAQTKDALHTLEIRFAYSFSQTLS